MSPRAPRARRAHAYHHGDLRAALLRSALELIAENDLARLSLRKVAERAGVSYAAPYHHFANKNDLLAAVAALAFDDLRVRLESAVRQKRSPMRRLEAALHAYLDFAIENPSYFRVMSMPEHAYVETAEGRAKLEAVQVCFTLLLDLVAEAGSRSREDPALRSLAVTVYAALRGFVGLCIDGDPIVRPDERGALQRALVGHLVTMVGGAESLR